MSGWMLELLRSADNPEQSLDHIDLEPGDDVLDAQLYFILTILLKENFMEKKKVETVEFGEGLRLLQLLVTGFEPQCACRKMVLQQGILNFSFGASEDPRKGIDRLEKQIRQYQSTTVKKIDDDTRTKVLLTALEDGNESHKQLGDLLVLNAYRVESFSEMKRGSHFYLGMKQWLTPGAADLIVGSGTGKQKGYIKGELTVQFAGQCFVCGKTGHRKSECWWIEVQLAISPSPSNKWQRQVWQEKQRGNVK